MFSKYPILKTIVEEACRLLFKVYFFLFHRVRVEGLENVPKGLEKLIIISNHESLIDGVLLWTYLDLNLKILVSRTRAQERRFRFFMQNDYAVPLDTMNPYSLKGIIDKVNKGTPLLVFPEGRMTKTGSIMKVYEGTGFVAYKTGAWILPVHLSNTYSTIFSKKKENRRRIFAPVAITIGKVLEPIALEDMVPKKRKKKAAAMIYKALCDMTYEATNRPSTLPHEFIRLGKGNGSRILYKDSTGKEVSYRRSLTGAFVLGGCLAKLPDKNIGLLLPNLTVTALIFMGLQLFRKVPVFLNYATGPAALQHSMELADLATIITSQQFLERTRINRSVFEGKNVIFIEELGEKIDLKQKFTGIMRSIFPGPYALMRPGEEKETAVILFTSGSEGVPKGVCLSHENIISNIRQALTKVDVRETDYFLNALPVFHSFGLTIGTILPMFAGAKAFLYVSPLHYRVVPEIAYDEGCTIFIGTNTFLNGYSKKAHPYDFYSMRYIFCGAEALSDSVFDRYAKVYGVRVMSGYGATECSPIISINNALEHEYGTVGKILPGMEYRLVPVEGIDNEQGRVGKLYIKGKNVMKGYLKNEKANEKFLVEDQGWYDTGDIVEITEDGFIRIVGRLKRFSKISGEMVSLTAVEEALAGQFGERKEVAVMAVSDERKGERLIIVTNSKDAEQKTVREILKAKGFSDLACPREIRYMKDIPKLGTGKIDYVRLKELL
ncbi:MAG: AMP-binding protein [Syntrophorhabdaceae bacterium]|nr:AMP-binding protein [Syntrophorhabdaceae bacterium]MDD5244370.1 AMP-binding protein [Syntrophorhabdaceae bacterium]